MTTRQLRKLSGKQLVSDLVCTITSIAWDYIEINFPDAYRIGQGSGSLIDAISIIEGYVTNAENYWYPFLVSYLPYSAPLHRLNDLRQLYQCSMNIQCKQTDYVNALDKLREIGLTTSQFEELSQAVSDKNNELISEIIHVMRVLRYKTTRTMDGSSAEGTVGLSDDEDSDDDTVRLDAKMKKKSIHSQCDNPDDLTRGYCKCLSYEWGAFNDIKEDDFQYVSRDGSIIKIKTTGLLGISSGYSRLADAIIDKILNILEFSEQQIKTVLNRYLSDKIRKYKRIHVEFNQKLVEETQSLKNDLTRLNVEIGQLTSSARKSEAEKKIHFVERERFLHQISALNSKIRNQKIMLNSAESSSERLTPVPGLRYKGK